MLVSFDLKWQDLVTSCNSIMYCNSDSTGVLSWTCLCARAPAPAGPTGQAYFLGPQLGVVANGTPL